MASIPLRDRATMHRKEFPRRRASQHLNDNLPNGMYRVKKTTKI